MGIAMRLREPRKPLVLTKRRESAETTGDDHVGIRLMTDVEQETIMGRIDERMYRENGLDRAEARSDVTAGLGGNVDDLGANFIRKYRKLFIGEEFELVG